MEGGGAHDAESGPEQVNAPSSFGVVQTLVSASHFFLFSSHSFRSFHTLSIQVHSLLVLELKWAWR